MFRIAIQVCRPFAYSLRFPQTRESCSDPRVSEGLAPTFNLNVVIPYAKPKGGTVVPAVSNAKRAATRILATNRDSSLHVTTAPVFLGTATANSYVVLLDGNNVVGAVPVDALGNWTSTDTGLSKGKRNVSFAALDAQGSLSARSATLAIQSRAGPSRHRH